MSLYPQMGLSLGSKFAYEKLSQLALVTDYSVDFIFFRIRSKLRANGGQRSSFRSTRSKPPYPMPVSVFSMPIRPFDQGGLLMTMVFLNLSFHRESLPYKLIISPTKHLKKH